MPVVDTDAPPAVDPATLSHNSQKPNMIVCAVVCVAIAAVFVSLRFYTRIRVSKSLGQSDWWLLASLVGSALQSAWFIDEAIHGLGSHVWDVDLTVDFIPVQKAAWFAILFYNISLCCIKISFLLLYLAIFTYSRSRLACQILLVLVILSAIWTITITATACIPLKAFWDLSIQGAYCHKTELWWVNTAFHVVTDLAIFIVPVPQIWSMNVHKRQKVVLMILFSLGFIVFFISIIRIIFLADLHRNKDPDFTWVGARFGYLSLVELNAGIVVACLMTLKPLLNQFFPGLFAPPVVAGAPFTQDSPPTIGTQGAFRDGNPNASTGVMSEIAPWEAQMSKAEGEQTSKQSTSS